MTTHPSNPAETAPQPPPTEVELLLSNLCMPPWFVATAGVGRHNEVMEELRDGTELFAAKGWEVTPTRRLLLDSFGDLAAGALHQTWAPALGGVLHEGRTSKSRLLHGLGALVVMPSTEESLHVLSTKAWELDGEQGAVPTVVYAEQVDSRTGKLMDFRPYGLTKCETQVTPESMRACSPHMAFEAVHGSLLGRSVHSVVVDTHHLTRGSRTEPYFKLDAAEILEAVWKADIPVTRIHASAGRVDSRFEADVRRSINELRALLTSSEKFEQTEMAHTAKVAYLIWRKQQAALAPGARMAKLPVTIEIPYKGLLDYLEQDRLSLADIMEQHRNAAFTLKAFFGRLALA